MFEHEGWFGGSRSNVLSFERNRQIDGDRAEGLERPAKCDCGQCNRVGKRQSISKPFNPAIPRQHYCLGPICLFLRKWRSSAEEFIEYRSKNSGYINEKRSDRFAGRAHPLILAREGIRNAE
jgi:hypothetical protein